MLATIGRAEGRDRRRQLHGSAARHEAAGRVADEADLAALGREMQEFLETEVQTAVFRRHAADPDARGRADLGVRATLALKIYGEDLDKLEELSAKLKTVVAGVPGVADLSAEANKGKPQMVIKVDRQPRHALRAECRRHPGWCRPASAARRYRH